ncbi:MAG: hypothetical protein U0800_22375 [Isosphaeraceae bacterium]
MIANIWLCACISAAAQGQDPAPKPAPTPTSAAPAPPEQLLLEELREQAREDLAIWEARVKARTAWLREATKRLETARVWRDLTEKQVKNGQQGRGILQQSELDIAELEARREQKSVELTEAQAKASRLKRRLAMLMKADKYEVLGNSLGFGSPFLPSSSEDRIADLEQQLERLRAEMDETRQTARAVRQELERLEPGKKAPAANVSPR